MTPITAYTKVICKITDCPNCSDEECTLSEIILDEDGCQSYEGEFK